MTNPFRSTEGDQLRDDVVRLIEVLRAIPDKTPAMERLQRDLQRAVDEYAREGK